MAFVFEQDGFYLNSEALRRIRTRLPVDGDAVTWQGTRLWLVPRSDGALFHVETATGGHDHDAIRSFVGQLLLHRIVERLDLPDTSPKPPRAHGEPGNTTVEERTTGGIP